MECTSTVLEISSLRIMKIYFHSLEYTKTDRYALTGIIKLRSIMNENKTLFKIVNTIFIAM